MRMSSKTGRNSQENRTPVTPTREDVAWAEQTFSLWLSENHDAIFEDGGLGDVEGLLIKFSAVLR
jgi:hypothetical protein